MLWRCGQGWKRSLWYMKTMEILTHGQWAQINQLETWTATICGILTAIFRYLIHPDPFMIALQRPKTDNAHNLQAKRSMWNTYVPLLYCLRCQLMPMARNKKWPMRLFYFHTTLNSGGFSGLVIRLLPKAGAPGAEPLAESGVVPRKLVFWWFKWLKNGLNIQNLR